MESIYEIVGVKDGKAIIYKAGTIKQICKDELLDIEGVVNHKDIDDVLRDMDIFSNFTHYARRIK